jgi:hypothetical protein
MLTYSYLFQRGVLKRIVKKNNRVNKIITFNFLQEILEKFYQIIYFHQIPKFLNLKENFNSDKLSTL